MNVILCKPDMAVLTIMSHLAMSHLNPFTS